MKGATCLEVWEGPSLLVRASAEGVHGAVSGGAGQLSGLAWAPGDAQLVYVAERAPNKHHASFFKPVATAAGHAAEAGTAAAAAATAAAEAAGRGRTFDLRDDWGEKLAGSDRLGLFCLDVARGTVAELPGATAGGTCTPAQPVVSADGSAVLFVAYPHAPKKLGLVYCFQRPCELRRVHLHAPGAAAAEPTAPAAEAALKAPAAAAETEAAAFEVLTPSDRVAFSPRLSRSGAQLAYLASERGFDTHVRPPRHPHTPHRGKRERRAKRFGQQTNNH